MPERYLIELPLVIHLGCFLIAYIRQAYQKREAHVIEEINIDEVNLHKKDIKIISKTIKRSILETDLKKKYRRLQNHKKLNSLQKLTY